MPLRPLRADGQPKTEKELSVGEQAGRKIELDDDKRMEVARAVRQQTEAAALSKTAGSR